MCTGIEGQDIPCGTFDENFVGLCQDEVDRRIEATYERYPILRLWVPDPSQPKCCQRDAIADAADRETAWAWDGLTFLRGDS